MLADQDGLRVSGLEEGGGGAAVRCFVYLLLNKRYKCCMELKWD